MYPPLPPISVSSPCRIERVRLSELSRNDVVAEIAGGDLQLLRNIVGRQIVRRTRAVVVELETLDCHQGCEVILDAQRVRRR